MKTTLLFSMILVLAGCGELLETEGKLKSVKDGKDDPGKEPATDGDDDVEETGGTEGEDPVHPDEEEFDPFAEDVEPPHILEASKNTSQPVLTVKRWPAMNLAEPGTIVRVKGTAKNAQTVTIAFGDRPAVPVTLDGTSFVTEFDGITQSSGTIPVKVVATNTTSGKSAEFAFDVVVDPAEVDRLAQVYLEKGFMHAKSKAIVSWKTRTVRAKNHMAYGAEGLADALADFKRYAGVTVELVDDEAVAQIQIRAEGKDNDGTSWCGSSWSSKTGQLIKANVRIDDVYEKKKRADHKTIFLHEVGHCLGLAHNKKGDEPNAGNLMGGSTREPFPAHIQRAFRLNYGARPER